MAVSRTYVLVHGAWHGGWCWRRVAARMRASGHCVFTPTQTGLGERSHLMSAAITIDTFIDDIANVLVTEELDDVVLVGHSFGGRVVCGVADRMPERLRRLVLLDSGLPENGKSMFDTLAPGIRDARLKAAQASSGGVSIPPPDVRSFGISDPGQMAWVSRRLTPQPLGPSITPITLRNPLGNGVAVSYIRATDPIYPVTEGAMADGRAGPDWHYLEIAAGHDAMITAPAVLADILMTLD